MLKYYFIVGIGVFGILFLLISNVYNPYLITMGTILMGMAATPSTMIFITSIQKKSTGPIKGRISAIRNIFLSIFSVVIFPLVSFFHEISIKCGLITSAIVCFLYFVSIFILNLKGILRFDDCVAKKIS